MPGQMAVRQFVIKTMYLWGKTGSEEESVDY